MLARIAILLLGAWICGTVLMAVVATLNFRTVDRILTRTGAEASPTFEEIPEKARRPALRHLASELNRLFFGAWGIAQLVLGGGVLVLLFFQTPRGMTNIVLAGVLVALVLIAAAFLTPSMVGGAQGLLIANLVANFFKNALIPEGAAVAFMIAAIVLLLLIIFRRYLRVEDVVARA